MTSASDSLLLLIFVVCVGLGLSIAQWTSNSKELFGLIIVVKVAMTTVMIITGSLGVWLYRRPPQFHSQLEHSLSQNPFENDEMNAKNGSRWFRAKRFISSSAQRLRRMFKYHVALVGLIVFCLPGLLVDCLKAISIMNCFKEFQSNSHHLQWYSIDLLYHLSRMFFLAVLLLCCYSFHDTKFKSCRRVWYSCSLILATAIIVGLDVLLHDILNGLSDRHFSSPRHTNSTSGNCVAGRTKLFKAYHWSSEIFYSLNVEFVVLATEVLIHIMLGIQSKHSTSASNTSLVSAFSSFQSVSIDAQQTRASWRYARVFKIVIYIVFIIMNCVHLASAVITFFSMHIFFRVSRWVFHLITFTALCIGFHATRRMSSSPRPYSGFEGLVVATCVGNIIWSLMNLYAETVFLMSSDDQEVSIVSQVSGIIANIFNIVAIFTQAKFMLHATRVKAGRCGEAKFTRFRAVLLCLALNNLTMWFVNSFILNKDVTATLVPAKYYSSSSWTIIVHLTVPLCLFFRFNSFALFLKTFFVQDYSSNVDAVTERETELTQLPVIACPSVSNRITQY
ncbi:hypothetical protein CAPTEDRAFT_189553 [Capitella teleta]|uniref:G-protein coupled receptors family 1 profile domain-containing protein n=1 Tax=Capitella teleta TaxID=283909 RepID=R7UGN4_CAPTE|nr:hypothetical protein CAPTEDRAFT_189553 [Capitella teleta]|eukprot:ELU05704.1 hypothetical protein CAPTEDRAFT_189553 [Capitella teleta]